MLNNLQFSFLGKPKMDNIIFFNKFPSNTYSCDKITDKGIETLAMKIARHLRKLRQLTVHFGW